MFLSSLAAVLRGPGQRPQPGSPSESRSGVGVSLGGILREWERRLGFKPQADPSMSALSSALGGGLSARDRSRRAGQRVPAACG